MKTRQILDNLVEQFKTGNIPEAISISSFPIPDIPMKKWSIRNRIIVAINNTSDARGFQQWKKEGRSVKKGSKAIYILSPCKYSKKDSSEDSNADDAGIYFKPTPVFKVEDTEGEDLEYMKEITVKEDLPFKSIAESLGVSVRTVPGNLQWRGYYSTRNREIVLATPHEKTFFHELAHAVDNKINSPLKNGQDPLQEVTAELAAQTLCNVIDKRMEDTRGNTYEYIERYAKEAKKSVASICIEVVDKVDKIVQYIVN